MEYFKQLFFYLEQYFSLLDQYKILHVTFQIIIEELFQNITCMNNEFPLLEQSKI